MQKKHKKKIILVLIFKIPKEYIIFTKKEKNYKSQFNFINNSSILFEN